MTTLVFDADSHLMETGDWLGAFCDPTLRDQLSPLSFDAAGSKAADLMKALPGVWETHRTQVIGADVISGPKGWLAPGALDTDVRSKVLDALAIDVQLVFPTFSVEQFAHTKNLDVLYGGTRALNRAMVAFCQPDARLKAVGFLPLNDPERAMIALDEALTEGVSAVWVPSDAPGDFSPAHVDLDPVWARMAEAGVPFVLHIGGGRLLPKAFHNNGLPRPLDWLGGGENLRAKDFPVVHHSPERFLACMVLDGVFERHPTLRGAAIELGANWVPALLRNVDHAHRSFAKFEPTLQSLSQLPSEYLRQHVKFTPFPFEDTAWLVGQCGPELFMFSTDYPHPEGGKQPFQIFDDAMSSFGPEAREQFFWGNGAELLGLAAGG